jgi:hypothetical protein
MYVWSATYNGQTIPVRGDALYRTGETATVQISGTSAPPATEPQPGPQPEPRSEPTPEPRPEPTPEPRPEPTPEPRSEPTPEPRPEPRPGPVPGPTFEPKTVQLGSGPDEVIFKVSQDWYLAAARYVVLVNGVQLGGVQEVSALRSSGLADTVVVRGQFGSDPTTVGIRFVNDAWGGNADKDRNMYVWSATYNGQTIPVRGDALYRTGETATVQFSGTSAPPATEPHPEPPVWYPGHITVGTGNDIMSFSFTTNGASIGVVGIAVDGVVVFQGNLASENFFRDVSVKFNSGGSSQFNIWYEGASGAHLSQVSYDGINLASLSQSLIGTGNAGFTLHTCPSGTSMTGSNGRDVFILGGGSMSVTTRGGQDLIVVRDPGTYMIEDFDQKQDRILFREMAHESLSVTNQEAHLVLGFEGGSVTLHNGAKLDADQIILV